jgi:uncharacterized phage protein (TIGR01671 family)
MRELKFRAWDEEKKRMLYSTESYDYGNTEFQFIDGELCVVRYRCGWNNFPIAEKAEGIKGVMQYTGLKDKNGREMYEQDIVDGFNNRFVIEYGINRIKKVAHDGEIVEVDVPSFYFRSLIYDDKVYPIVGDLDGLEVIGNVYQNPELLEVEKG